MMNGHNGMTNGFKSSLIIMDGGMGRELERIGAPFRQPEWSACTLFEDPSFVKTAHQNFLEIGAQVITTNTYAIVPYHIGDSRFNEQADDLVDLAGQLAREAADKHEAKVVGSIPPTSGSYRPELFDELKAEKIINKLIVNLEKHVDYWLGETISSLEEAKLVSKLLKSRPIQKDMWLSFTIMDSIDPEGPSRLRSNELVKDVVRDVVLNSHAKAILFNCSHVDYMEQAVKTAYLVITELGRPDILLGVNANAFVPINPNFKANKGFVETNVSLTPDKFYEYAKKWKSQGASIIGGCCGVFPNHIEKLVQLQKE